MSFQSVLITSYNSGLVKDKKPYLLIDDAFQKLENAYTWRERVKKREGIKLVGRLRRCFTIDVTLSTQATGTSYNNADILADSGFALRATEPNAEIEPGSFQATIGNITVIDTSSDGVLVQTGTITDITQAGLASVTTTVNHALVTGNIINISGVTGMTEINNSAIQPYTITVTGVDTFTLDGVNSTGFGLYTGPSGTWIATAATTPNTGTINYATGELDLTFSPAIGATNVDIQMCYFPALPAMGIDKRELAAINVEQTVFFDTKYTYVFDGNNFSSPSSTIWAGTDSDFFWMTNYRGSTPQERLFFATNNASPVTSTNNRIRHTTDVATWTNFTPAVSGKQVNNEGVGAGVVTPWATFAGTLGQTPVIPGSVTITVSNGVDATVGFRDQLGTYPAGTLNGSPSTNSGIIDYATGAFTLNFTPNLTADATVNATYQHETSFLFQAKILLPYYGRLLAFNVFEGATAGTSVNIFNRVRFSQTGNPTQQDAWISSIPGKGGFIDAPTNEAIVSARFYKNTLIVFFERSTWQLRYVGDFGLPFLWERISSDFGSESTFSTVLFDGGILAVGDKAIIASSGNDATRIDLQIPDTVFEFNNDQDGKKRVQGIRDFAKEIVYWTYSEGGISAKFPNRTLLYNYRNNSFAVFRDNVTVFGPLSTPTGILWDLPISWDSETSWDTSTPAEFPAIVSGNQQGWVHWYQSVDAEVTADSDTDMNEHESLAITGITLSAANKIRITVVNHNLVQDEIIFITNLLFVDSSGAAVATNLNGKFYQVTFVNANSLDLTQWNFTDQKYETTSHDNIAYTPDPADSDTYVGGGQVALIQNISIFTKDFNPFVNEGNQIKMSYIDFMTDATPNSAISVDLFLNNSLDTKGNIYVGNTETETAINQFGRVEGITQANPGVVTAPHHGLQTGQTITFRLVGGMTEVNGIGFAITHISENSFSINEDTSGFTAYTSGGEWISTDDRFYVPGSKYAWHRFYATCYGQYISVNLFYDNNLMNTVNTHQSGFELNSMNLWLKKGGTLPF